MEVKAPDNIPTGYAADKMIAALKAIPGMTSEAAQKFLEADVQAYAGAMAEHEKAFKLWDDQVKADPDMGGAKYDTAMVRVSSGMEFLGGKALAEVLGPLAKHPLVVKALHTVGAKLAEDSSGTAPPGGAPREKTQAERLVEAYPTMYHPDGTPK